MSSIKYDQLLKFLYFEGYAESYAEAEELLESMSDEEFDEIIEAFKEPDLAKMRKQEDRHRTKAVKQKGGSRGSSKNRAMKMGSIRGALERGEDPRADGYGGKRAERGNPPEDHRAAFSKNPLNNPPRRVKKPGVQREEFESVVEYLFVEGFADTIKSAENMAENISETWANNILEARASEKRGLGSPESPLSYPGREIQKERGRKGGRHQYSGGVEYGGSSVERGRKKSDPQSQVERLRRLSNYPEKPGKYSRMQTKKRDIGSRFD